MTLCGRPAKLVFGGIIGIASWTAFLVTLVSHKYQHNFTEAVRQRDQVFSHQLSEVLRQHEGAYAEMRAAQEETQKQLRDLRNARAAQTASRSDPDLSALPEESAPAQPRRLLGRMSVESMGSNTGKSGCLAVTTALLTSNAATFTYSSATCD